MLGCVDWQVVGALAAGALAASTIYRLLQRQQREATPVLTQSGTQAWERPRPQNPCRACGGYGRVPCGRCYAIGIFNPPPASHMMPKGERMRVCWECRGTAQLMCVACAGSGQRPKQIGFRT